MGAQTLQEYLSQSWPKNRLYGTVISYWVFFLIFAIVGFQQTELYKFAILQAIGAYFAWGFYRHWVALIALIRKEHIRGMQENAQTD